MRTNSSTSPTRYPGHYLCSPVQQKTSETGEGRIPCEALLLNVWPGGGQTQSMRTSRLGVQAYRAVRRRYRIVVHTAAWLPPGWSVQGAAEQSVCCCTLLQRCPRSALLLVLHGACLGGGLVYT